MWSGGKQALMLCCPPTSLGFEIFARCRYNSVRSSSSGFTGLIHHSRGRLTITSQQRSNKIVGYPMRMGNQYCILPSVRWIPEREDDSATTTRRRIYPIDLEHPNSRSRRRSAVYIHQARWFSSKSSETVNGPEKETTTLAEKKAGAATATITQADVQGTEPEFASYLSGEMKPPSLLDNFGMTKISANAILNQRRSTAAKRSRTFALDNDKELYKQIINVQVMQKERSRLKTASNVYRALLGNVIICTGTFFKAYAAPSLSIA